MRSDRKSRESEIQAADPGARRRAVWVVVVFMTVGGALATGIHFHGEKLELWVQEQLLELAARPAIMFLVAFVVAIPLVGASVPVFRQASRIVKSQRAPPPGQKVVRDTPVLTGRKAIRQGRVLQVMAALMAIFGLLVPFGTAIVLMLLQKGN